MNKIRLIEKIGKHKWFLLIVSLFFVGIFLDGCILPQNSYTRSNYEPSPPRPLQYFFADNISDYDKNGVLDEDEVLNPGSKYFDEVNEGVLVIYTGDESGHYIMDIIDAKTECVVLQEKQSITKDQTILIHNIVDRISKDGDFIGVITVTREDGEVKKYKTDFFTIKYYSNTNTNSISNDSNQ